MATGTSTLLLDEYLQTADPRLLGAMLASTQESHLRSLVERLVEGLLGGTGGSGGWGELGGEGGD